MGYWSKPAFDRGEASFRLNASIDMNHPVRLLDEILRSMDWSAWEQEYNGERGQPPIPPWVLAGVILYGLMRRIRSSRQLEYACTHNIDFMWLAEGRTIDFTTISKFRRKFQQPLKELFKQINQVAMGMGLIKLVEVAFDGTRVKADASRLHTWTAEKVEAVLKEVEAQIERMLGEADVADAADAAVWGEGKPRELPPELADAKKRREKFQEILEKLRQADEARRKDGIDVKKNPAQLPKADTDSKVMPNKEGGYAPNYTPTAAPDGTCGFIVDCDVIGGPNEQNELLPSMERIKDDYGKYPEKPSADKAFGTGPNLEGMESRGMDFHTPVESPVPQEGNPAKREDPRQAVPQSEWPNLPRNDKNRLDKSCFVYDEASDTYFCPMGREMPYRETKKSDNGKGFRVYGCKGWEGCPLAKECVDPKSKRGRTVSRDGYEPARERMYAKMQTEEGRKTYNRRMHVGETPFAVIKGILGVRRFLLRGVEKVRIEWRWVCTAYNLRKLIAAVAALRAEAGRTAASLEG
jgi:transposase